MSQVWVECTCTLPAPCDFPSGISVFAVSLSFFSLPLFINFCFWLHWVSWAATSHCSSRASCFYAWTFSSCGEWGLLSSCGARASHCSGFSCGGVQALGHVGFSDCGIGLSCLRACGILVPGPGIEPVSPALAGRLLTIGQPGKLLFACSTRSDSMKTDCSLLHFQHLARSGHTVDIPNIETE